MLSIELLHKMCAIPLLGIPRELKIKSCTQMFTALFIIAKRLDPNIHHVTEK